MATRARSAITAAVACALVFTAGGFAARHFVQVRMTEQARFLTTVALSGFSQTRFNGGHFEGPYRGSTSVDGHTFEIVLDSGEVVIRSANLATYYPTRAPLPPAPPDGLGPSTRFATQTFGPGAVPGPDNNLANRTFQVQAEVVDLPVEVVRPLGRAGHFFFSGLPDPLVVPDHPTYVRATVWLFVDPYSTERAVGGVDGALAVGLPLSVLFVALVAWLVAGRALRPVAAIRAEMATISEHALQRRVPVPVARDEIADLAATTNATLDRLQRAMHQQQQFVADASHELRSPLANLRTWLDVARAHPEHTDWLAVTERAGQDIDRMQALITDLLLLAQHDAQQRPLPDRLVDIAALAEEQVAERRYVVDGLTIHADTPAEVLVPGHAEHLERVLRNLLDNAVRHAESSVWVTVTSDAPDRVILEVRDDGPGISPADRDRVFDRFTRLDDARTRDTGGTGLGLAIASVIVHRHGGTLTVADGPGGARFVVTLPRANKE
ncbi:hypothetical protein ALI144C_23485 [Actinosynnema sp. ALI-1.44]|nr:hypothetical protein ALI144C_23485 [Actinosynnema sp. ALI-1.44]